MDEWIIKITTKGNTKTFETSRSIKDILLAAKEYLIKISSENR